MPTNLLSFFEKIGKLFGHKEQTVNQKISPTAINVGDIIININSDKD